MERKINSCVFEHLLDLQHPDLNGGVITAAMIESAGDAVADLMLDLGFQLQNSFMDGGDVVHSYLNPRNGHLIEGFSFTLELLTELNLGPCLHVLWRATGPTSVHGSVFGQPIRKSRGWYLPLMDSASVKDLIYGALPRQPGLIRNSSTDWQIAA